MNQQRQKVRRSSSKRIGRFAWVGSTVVVFALAATAAVSLRTGDAKNSTPQPGKIETNRSSRLAAGSVSFQPQTGQIRPLTQDEAQKLADGIKQLVNQSTDGLQSVRHADGTVELNLDGRFQNMAVARRNADGTVTESCIDNPKVAADFFGIDPQLVGVPADTDAASKQEIAQPAKGVER